MAYNAEIKKEGTLCYVSPVKLSGGKERGSGYVFEQLFREFCPQSKGLPMIL